MFGERRGGARAGHWCEGVSGSRREGLGRSKRDRKRDEEEGAGAYRGVERLCLCSCVGVLAQGEEEGLGQQRGGQARAQAQQHLRIWQAGSQGRKEAVRADVSIRAADRYMGGAS